MENRKRPRGRPKSQFTESSAGTLQSLDRALGILATLAETDGVALSDLSRALDVPTATTHRILNTLEKHGFVNFLEARQEWRIGIEAYRVGAAFLKNNSVIEIGRPVMDRLMRETGETANLAVPDGSEVVFVAQVETTNPIRAFFPPGTRTPMHASGTGKAILAAMERGRLDDVLRSMDLSAYTGNTLADQDALKDDLTYIRKRRWSHDREERFIGMSCIGAPIFNEQMLPCAGVSVSGPTVRFDDGQIDGLGKKVVEAANEITHLSGGRLPV